MGDEVKGMYEEPAKVVQPEEVRCCKYAVCVYACVCESKGYDTLSSWLATARLE